MMLYLSKIAILFVLLDGSMHFKTDNLSPWDHFHWKCFVHGPVRDSAHSQMEFAAGFSAVW